MLDLRILGGTLVDGTGTPRRVGDLGIVDGRIVAIGRVDEPADRTIDAAGLIVAPGFVDLHTHYDAQLFWDPAATPSSLHGVTTAIGGNCGFTIAPISPEATGYITRMLARVEGMSLEALEEGVPWGSWHSFGEYLDNLEDSTSINVGFLVGHSALRRVVMGAASGYAARDDQIAAMVLLLHESLEAGGLGFSSSQAPSHSDGDGDPVPSRAATNDELLALAAAVGGHAGTTLEFIPTLGEFSEERMELMAGMSRAADRPLNWNSVRVSARGRQTYRQQLSASDYAATRGGRVVGLTIPLPSRFRLNLLTGMIFESMPVWRDLMSLSIQERVRALADPKTRTELAAADSDVSIGQVKAGLDWRYVTIVETFAPENDGLTGRTVADVARERGEGPIDTLCDIAVADDLRTGLLPGGGDDDDESWRLRAEVWRDPRALIGASDAGAHLDMIDSFTYTTALLGDSVRERGLLQLEEAVHMITDAPARFYGVRDRGRIAIGWHADLTLFDEARIGPGDVATTYDLPGGGGRLAGTATGIEHVVVNGTPIVRGGVLTGDTPGRLLRSGRDTDTVGV